ncbi:hypothetical protein PCANC_16270 [Puccinia coronata f. sp. avenae]|uniref:Uncharacterized protein n=1 Tax=Puccinia coronata f. sp. avenae TaxID=200324 RepID=A0A2N5TVM2_9BASI|nr:hypothetical protein PCASD_15973 [Puccinia coronata f. sp. avenae]PLW33759.1 hypothetical protein PCANC_16270 [Puccinia coronata f. sp. avenae]
MYQTLRVFTKLTTSEQPALSNRLVRPVLRPIPSSGRNEWLDRFILATHLCIHVSIYPFLYQRDNPQTHGSQIGNVPIDAMQTTVTSATPVTAPLAFTAMSLPVTIGHA